MLIIPVEITDLTYKTVNDCCLILANPCNCQAYAMGCVTVLALWIWKKLLIGYQEK